MKVLEIFAFLELLSTATKSIIESVNKGHWVCSSYHSPGDQTVMVYAN